MRELRFVRLQIASARPIAARIEPVRRPMLRHYSRDPRQAEEEASTVRGHRVERARTESGSASSSSTASSSSSGGTGQQEYKEGRSYEGASLGAKLANAWNSTPIKWYPIPVLLGACVLVGVQARRNYVRDRREERGTKAKIVDENGKVVTMQGPWTVSLIRANLQIHSPDHKYQGLRLGGSASQCHLKSMGLGQWTDAPCLVPALWLPAICAHLWVQPGRDEGHRPDPLQESRRVLLSRAQGGGKAYRRCSSCELCADAPARS